MNIRMAHPNDCRQMLDIYGPVIKHTVTSFEYEVPSISQFRERVLGTMKTFPWLVSTWDDVITGYAYAGPHRSREAYRWSAELSVYVHPEYYRRGIAKALYHALMSILRLQGYYTALAGISLPNDTSVRFHEALGFTPVGVYHNVGYKFGKWHTTGWWECSLQPYQQKVVGPLALMNVCQLPDYQAILDAACNELKIGNDKL